MRRRRRHGEQRDPGEVGQREGLRDEHRDGDQHRGCDEHRGRDQHGGCDLCADLDRRSVCVRERRSENDELTAVDLGLR